jgi:hypothetical protein
MRSYAEIHAIAADRKGGAKALDAMLTRPKPPEMLEAIARIRGGL